MSLDELKSRLKKAVSFVKELSGDIAILLIAHLETDEVENDYDEFSVKTSYYSDAEFQEILSAFKNIAVYVDVSFGEKEFIKKVQNNQFSHLDKFRKIAYTQTASGTARSKSALIPAFCDLYGIKYCCNDIFTGALLDNKIASSQLLRGIGMKLPETWVYYHKKGWIGDKPPDKLKLICKPGYECASMGVTEKSVSDMNPSFLEFIHDLSLHFRQPVLVQTFIEGYEIEVPVMEIDTPVVPGITGMSLNGTKNLGTNILSYYTIFEDGFELFDFSEVDQNVAKQVEQQTLWAYTTLHLRGPVRMDFRVTAKGDYYLMDYNNSPHLGSQHSFAFAFKHLGFSYDDMIRLIIYPTLI